MDELSYLNIPLFSGLGRVDLAKIVPELDKMDFGAGQVIFNSGDVGDSLYIIAEGSVKIVSEKGEEVNVLGNGECFGEMALLTGQPRSAGVVAVTDTKVLVLSKLKFDRLLKKHHSLAVYFAGLLSERLATVIGSSGSPPAGENAGAGHLSGKTKPRSTGSAGWLTGNKKILTLGMVAVLGIIIFVMLGKVGLNRPQAVLAAITFAATALWAFNIYSAHVIAFAMPVSAVIFQAASPQKAFSGFSNPSWFLILGVLAITAAISKTGLMYRLALIVIGRFPSSYLGQTLAWALAGTLLTPVIPSSNGRAALVAPMLTELFEALRLKSCSTGSAGLAMSCLLGFGHMSVLFMNGAAICYLVLGLLPPEVSAGISYGYWFKSALPMSLAFLALSYISIMIFYRHGERLNFKAEIIQAQLKLLGPLTLQEKLALLAIGISLLGFITESSHHISGAVISLVSFLLVYGSAVLKDQDVRSEIDWNLLISFGAMISFGNILSSSGLTSVISISIGPYLQYFMDSKLVFLLVVVVFVVLLRLFLPITPALMVTMLTVTPFTSVIGISPFVVGLVALLSSNPWFLHHQNVMYFTILQGTGEKLFRHDQALKLSFAYVAVCLVSVAVSVPLWRAMGLM